MVFLLAKEQIPSDAASANLNMGQGRDHGESQVAVVRSALEILRDEEQEIHWDDAWDSLKLLSVNDAELAPILQDALKAKGDFVKHFALEALERIGVPADSYIDELERLLVDDDWEVVLHALKRVKTLASKADIERLFTIASGRKQCRALLRWRSRLHFFVWKLKK